MGHSFTVITNKKQLTKLLTNDYHVNFIGKSSGIKSKKFGEILKNHNIVY